MRSYTPLQTQEGDVIGRMTCAVSNVVCRRMVLGVVIGEVGRTFCPVETELILCGTTAEPVKAHPNHFNAALYDGVRDEAGGSRIVCLDRRSWLFPIIVHDVQCWRHTGGG